MHLTRFAAATFALASLSTGPSYAQSADDVGSLRHDIETLRQDYEARIGELEARLARAEAAAAQPAPSADATQLLPTPVVEAASPAAAPASTNPNIYNPGIAVALNGNFVAARNDTGSEAIAGFAAGDEIGRPARGFSLGESEISFTANIDPFLAGVLNVSLGADNSASVEEAYVRTTALPGGFTVKAGRFFSGIGYINERHAHDWSFSDAPLPYRAFLNTQLADDGVQLRWIAPTDQYLEFGAEALRGDGYPAGGGANNGVGTYTGFVRTGNDLGVSGSYLASLSYVHGEAEGRESGAGDLFSGTSDLGIATVVYKWAPGGNPLVRNLTLVGEYFQSRDDGAFNGVDFSQDHSGWYAQGVYQFMPRWSVGLRIAGVNSDNPGAALAGTALDESGRSPMEYTGLVEFDTSEFGRLRLHYSRDESGLDPNDVLTFQYTVIYGPHGAHRY